MTTRAPQQMHVRLPPPNRTGLIGVRQPLLGFQLPAACSRGGALVGHPAAAVLAAAAPPQQRRLQQPGLACAAALPAASRLRQQRHALPLPPTPSLAPAAATALAARRRAITCVQSAAVDPLVNLGSDFLTFLVATVLVVPVFKAAKQSPVLGYLFAGLVLGQLGLFRNLEEVERLSELGVLFLLFEMGLELSIDRLRALAGYAFGMGTLQMVLCVLTFTVLGLPPGHAPFSQFLETVLHVPPSLANLRTVDEAVVIGAALSLSSSAFVLQLLRERGELDSRFGQATLGILLLQDIATVPFLVLLPLIEGSNSALLEDQDTMQLLLQLGPTVLKTLGGLGVVLLGGRLFMRRVFELVAEARSEETFIALCLLSVTGASLLTQRLGFSDTLGAFVAGVLLSETNFKTQVEADIQPFRGILLGLFFVTTGSSMDVGLLVQQWPLVMVLLVGLLSTKIAIITALGPRFGLTRQESIRTGFLLSQGGEFAFVLLALANQLDVLPAELNRLLIIVVVLSMALTPLLAEVGKRASKWLQAQDGEALGGNEGYNLEEPVLICGFGDVGQTVANLLSSPALGRSVPYIAFDLTVGRVQAAQEAGFNVIYGDGSRTKVLHAAGVERPKAIVVSHTARQNTLNAVESLHEAFPGVPIYVRALDMKHAAALQEAGATHVVTAETEAGLAVGSQLARGLGVDTRAVAGLADVMRVEMDARSSELAAEMRDGGSGEGGSGGSTTLAVSVFKFDQSKAPAYTDDLIRSDQEVAAGPEKGSDLIATIIQKLGSSTSSSVAASQEWEDLAGEDLRRSTTAAAAAVPLAVPAPLAGKQEPAAPQQQQVAYDAVSVLDLGDDEVAVAAEGKQKGSQRSSGSWDSASSSGSIDEAMAQPQPQQPGEQQQQEAAALRAQQK